MNAAGHDVAAGVSFACPDPSAFMTQSSKFPHTYASRVPSGDQSASPSNAAPGVLVRRWSPRPSTPIVWAAQPPFVLVNAILDPFGVA